MLKSFISGFRDTLVRVFCRHDYRFFSKTNGRNAVYECKKCGRVKIERW